MNVIDGAGTGACVDKLEAAKRDTTKRTRAWMNRNSGSTYTWRPRKKQRVSSYKVGLCLDTVLSHRGRLSSFLKKVQVAKEVSGRFPPHAWPVLSMSWDQGTDNVAWLNHALRVLRLNMDASWDFSHLVSTIWQHALKKAKLRPQQKLLLIAWLCRHGPWEERRRWYQANESMDGHLELMSWDECPLFAQSIGKNCRDRGTPERSFEPGIGLELWEEWQHGVTMEVLWRSCV